MKGNYRLLFEAVTFKMGKVSWRMPGDFFNAYFQMTTGIHFGKKGEYQCSKSGEQHGDNFLIKKSTINDFKKIIKS